MVCRPEEAAPLMLVASREVGNERLGENHKSHRRKSSESALGRCVGHLVEQWPAKEPAICPNTA